MTKRKTRTTNTNDDDIDLCGTGLSSSKRERSKKTCVNKLLFEQKTVVNNPDVDEPTFTTLTPVPLDQHTNINDQENTPPPLIIDVVKQTCPSQSIMSDHFLRSESIGKHLPCHTTNAIHTTSNYLANNSTRFISYENRSVNIDQSNKERPPEGNRTPIADRLTEGQYSSNIRSQSSTPGIVVSVDRRGQNSNEDFNHNYRTSTPIRPSRRDQINISLHNDNNDSFSIDSIPKETYDILSRFPEFRRLVKAYYQEKKTSDTWSKDYARLKKNYDQLEANSFPRPPAPVLNFLVDLVTQIQHSGGRGDARSDEQLARDLGESPVFLMGLKDVTPQQTALNLFNHFYPGYEVKVNLVSINNLEVEKPGLLENILTFAQRASPGANYKIQELRDCLSNSIRGARHHWRKLQRSVAYAAANPEDISGDLMGLQD
ncbi:unnamed protein product [Rotaria sordida]|uniref:Uncharacterized protein n=1 Tax=Rotaria sordida TaxID=392033 RepID=A0A813RUB4_9BILA|nr:unnamed protein product [Rotaria sordida]CAF3579998.1 unnamed protein product [Rotaria sordida]